MIQMQKAIIDPRVTVYRVTGYAPDGSDIVQQIPDSARVAEVTDVEFPVAEPLFWVACPDEAKADQWYYDTVQKVCLQIPSPPAPEDQPAVNGAQTL